MTTNVEKPKKVGVFFDYENIVYSLRNRFEQKANFEALMATCNTYGQVCIARAYADWGVPYISSALMYALQSSGFDLSFVPTGGTQANAPRKNVADLYLAMDVLETLYTNDDIDIYVLLTGDRDFMPLVNMLKRCGKMVVAIGVDGSSSYYLTQAVDDFHYYSEVQEGFEASPKRLKGQPTNIYDALVQALGILSEKGKKANLTHLKPTMIELMEGFDEREYKDSKGRPFMRFKDFIMEAKRRGVVDVVSRGTSIEVFIAKNPKKGNKSSSERSSGNQSRNESRSNRSSQQKESSNKKKEPVVIESEVEEAVDNTKTSFTLDEAFLILMRAVKTAQTQGKSFRVSSIQSLINRKYKGFDQDAVHNENGKPFDSFADFAQLAADRGLVNLSGNGMRLQIRPASEERIEDENSPAENEIRHAILSALRDYQSYPVSFLSLSNHCVRWCGQHNITVADTQSKALLTEAVNSGIIRKIQLEDGRKQYVYNDKNHQEGGFVEVTTSDNGRQSSSDKSTSTAKKIPQPQASEESSLDELVGLLVASVQKLEASKRVTNLANVKGTMREGYPAFNEKTLADPNGKPFARFKDFVQYAEESGLVKMVGRGGKRRVILLEQAEKPAEETAETIAPVVEEQQAEQAPAKEEKPRRERRDRNDRRDKRKDRQDNAPKDAVVAPVQEEAVQLEIPTAPSAGTPVPATSPASFDGYKSITDEAASQWMLDSLKAYNAYPVPFMGLVAFCRERREQEKIHLTNRNLRDLLNGATQDKLLVAVEGTSRPTLYKLDVEDAEAISDYLSASSMTSVEVDSTEEVADTAPVVESAPVVVEATPEPEPEVIVPETDWHLVRSIIADSLKAYRDGTAPFADMIKSVQESVNNAEELQGETINVRDLMRKAKQASLIKMASIPGQRPVLFQAVADDAVYIAFVGEKVVAPIVEPTPEPAPEPVVVETVVEEVVSAPEEVAPAPEPETVDEPETGVDIDAILVTAVATVLRDNKSNTSTNIKKQLKKLIPGFKESDYSNAEGKPFSSISAFLKDAQARGVVTTRQKGRGLFVELPTVAVDEGTAPDIANAAPIHELEPAFTLLVQAVSDSLANGTSCRLSVIRNRMKQLNETFNFDSLRRADGKPFEKFSEFVRLAAESNLVVLEGVGIQQEVSLPESA